MNEETWRKVEDAFLEASSLDPGARIAYLAGTRIPVALLAGIHREGKSVEYIANDYGLPVKTVQQALDHVDKKAA